MSKTIPRAFALWLPLIVGLTGVFGFSYIAVQQNYRQAMNDPQIQMAENIATSLARDYTPAAFVPRSVTPVDLRTSLDTWISIYGASGTPLESSGVLDGAPPRLADGLLDPTTWASHKTWEAPSGPETRVSWQPRPDVRQALVLVRFDGPHGPGFVAVGRSMHLVEERVIGLTKLAALAWSVTAVATFVAIFILLALGWL